MIKEDLSCFMSVRRSRLSHAQIAKLPFALQELYSLANGINLSDEIDLVVVPYSELNGLAEEENFDLWRAWVSAVPFAWSDSERSIVGLSRFRGNEFIVHIDADDCIIRPICDSVDQFLALAKTELSLTDIDPEWPSSVLYSGILTIQSFQIASLDVPLASRFARSMAAFYFACLATIDRDCLETVVASGNEDLLEALVLELRRRKFIHSDMIPILLLLATHANANIAQDSGNVLDLVTGD